MKRSIKFRHIVLPLALGGLVSASMVGCEDSPLGNLAEQCGLACSDKGVLDGNAAISGNASIDAFFGAVVDFRGAAGQVSGTIRTQLDAMALSLGLEEGAAGADIKAALQAKLDANVKGGLKVKFQPPKCEASLEVTANAAASCDASVDPGSVEVKCEGSCSIDASAQADCSAKGGLTCKGQAPSLACEGTCTGECNLEVGAACEGTCRGECTGECSVKDSSGNCAGSCDGECKGSCELKAGGSCSGKCEGSCEYTPPSGSCDATAEAKCSASAEANVQCKGGCDGKVTPPKVSAECKATVEAKADANVQCVPPALDVSWQWSAEVNGDLEAQAQFKAWLNGFKAQYSAILAASAKAELLVSSATNLAGAGKAAVEGFAGSLDGSLDLKATIGAGCALAELPKVGDALSTAKDELVASGKAVVDISAVIN